jgi:hypothetical protein
VRGPSPTVTTVVDQEKYCMGQPGGLSIEHQPPDAITLRLRVRVWYRNPTQTPLILPIYHELSALVVRPTSERAASARGEFVLNFKRRQRPTDELPVDISSDNPFNQLFHVLPPHQVLDRYFVEYVVMRVHNPSGVGP